MTPATATFFSRPWMQLRAGPSSSELHSKGSTCEPTTFTLQQYQGQHVCQVSRPESATTSSEGGVVWICETGAGDYHDGFPTGRHYRRRRGIGRSYSRCDQVELPRLARPKGCCDICKIRSFGEQSGRTTGRLGSTGLRAMPSEGRHSRPFHSFLPMSIGTRESEH